MGKLKNYYPLILWCIIFVAYALFAARPVPKEIVVTQSWIRSLDSKYSDAAAGGSIIPFSLGKRFGYISDDGAFTMNRLKEGNLILSSDRWAEFSGKTASVSIKDPREATLFTLENLSGYPFFLANKLFLMHNEQNTISRLGDDGKELWRYSFSSTITCVDAAEDCLLAGMLDGSIELIDITKGERVFFTEPSGSRVAVIYGCALSRKGDKLALIAGRDNQRFILFEKTGTLWRITYHEFLGKGFNRRVAVKFIDDGQHIVFERETGLGIYNIGTRNSQTVPLAGRIINLDTNGMDNLLFLVVEEKAEQKKLVSLSMQGKLLASAPFQSQAAFLNRRGKQLILGGGSVLSAFTIEEK